MNSPNLSVLPAIILQDDKPVFNEPWEAQAFAMAVNLHQNGAFGWDEWASALSFEIHSGVERSYYQHWLSALEKLVSDKSLTTRADLEATKTAWHTAASATPHGEPIVLK
ncbi:nitrile hydratase accessory protein [Pseudovibrio sp. Tun.PSC04-5.I4]|uniref:nitrile hydratase accessory protein n=1 Tax=Pseudovibrio sp. Tun.PSC04-5.I4 TaxID=1798213 RepID=UPI000881C05F|nr:nitrile hydratase accessory protein [Pseudovibrio sp. Tun.PSC04-5.I4]SDQ31080.1 nitrile hydratase accessory protein [Pseudovibrio sp. Tun.PSC04-5.I4]SDQ33926.1 nitrile hydratase accessory protein [Pseudovibrio sp. Tun.PSC04-5.I4]